MTNQDSSLTNETTLDSEPKVQSEPPRQNAMEEFYQLRDSLLISTLLITSGCFALVWYFYSLSTSLSYLLGAICGLMYVNMLSRDVEKISPAKRRLGASRLALFVGLIVVATQWQRLQVIPVFFGFMTYKASILFYVLPNSLIASKNKKEKG